MSTMNVKEVAEFLGIQEVRVQRLARESLLVPQENDAEGNPIFASEDVQRYKQFAERLGGI